MLKLAVLSTMGVLMRATHPDKTDLWWQRWGLLIYKYV